MFQQRIRSKTDVTFAIESLHQESIFFFLPEPEMPEPESSNTKTSFVRLHFPTAFLIDVWKFITFSFDFSRLIAATLRRICVATDATPRFLLNEPCGRPRRAIAIFSCLFITNVTELNDVNFVRRFYL